MKKFLTKKRKRQILKWAAIGTLATFVTVIFIAESKLSRLVVGGLGESFSTRVYSSPTLLSSRRNSFHESPDRIVNRLKRLHYEQVVGLPQTPGTFAQAGSNLSIYLRGFAIPSYNQQPQYIQLSEKGLSWSLEDSEGQELDEVAIEPEMMAELSGKEKIRREPAGWEEIPVRLADAVVAAEDGLFYRHWGINPKSIARAFMKNLTHGGTVQGGSTITQQLAKNFFLTPKRTIQRKILEVMFALYLELRYSKEKILTLYLNHIYMGQDGYMSIAGVKSAAQFYFGKPLTDLDLADCALLAGLIRSPYRYNPFKDPEKSLDRRRYVLTRMLKEKFISEAEYNQAMRQPLRVLPHPQSMVSNTDHDYFVAEVVRQLTPIYGEEVIYRYGFQIYTTMDPVLQSIAQSAVKKSAYQGALVVLDPQTGYVKALVGGKSFKESQFNRATQAIRQPGSVFKPIVYGAALENGMTLATVLHDVKRTYTDFTGKKWAPRNSHDDYRGDVTMREALAYSLNSAALDAVQQIGPAKVVEFARRLGITSPIEKSLALALGTSEVTLLEITCAYAAFANGGFRIRPQIILGIEDSQDQVIDVASVDRASVLDPALSYLMTSLLETVTEEGTAKSLANLGWTFKAAGKTGTTNNGKDAWFIGYTPEIVAGAWVGDDQAKSIHVFGASHALPIWAEFMRLAYAQSKPADFEKPREVISIKIDPISGLLANSGCPETKREDFIAGTEPTLRCPLHAGGVSGWFKKMFGKN